MPSGGSRVRSGPPRQRDSVRHGRGGDGGWTALPASGREGDPPPWPRGLPRPNKAERELWEDLWRAPIAVEWERRGWALQVAGYVRTIQVALQRGAAAGKMAQAMSLEDRLGMTESGMSRLRCYITNEPAPAAPKRSPTSSAKDRLTMIQGGADVRAS